MSHPSTKTKSLSGVAATSASVRARLEDFYELTKPRLSFLSVITAVVGYLSANPARNLSVLITLVLGTSLAAGGAAVLNQWMERNADAKMARTRNREHLLLSAG